MSTPGTRIEAGRHVRTSQRPSSALRTDMSTGQPIALMDVVTRAHAADRGERITL